MPDRQRRPPLWLWRGAGRPAAGSQRYLGAAPAHQRRRGGVDGRRVVSLALEALAEQFQRRCLSAGLAAANCKQRSARRAMRRRGWLCRVRAAAAVPARGSARDVSQTRRAAGPARRWQQRLAFALAQHRRCGGDSPAHQMPHEYSWCWSRSLPRSPRTASCCASSVASRTRLRGKGCSHRANAATQARAVDIYKLRLHYVYKLRLHYMLAQQRARPPARPAARPAARPPACPAS